MSPTTNATHPHFFIEWSAAASNTDAFDIDVEFTTPQTAAPEHIELKPFSTVNVGQVTIADVTPYGFTARVTPLHNGTGNYGASYTITQENEL